MAGKGRDGWEEQEMWEREGGIERAGREGKRGQGMARGALQHIKIYNYISVNNTIINYMHYGRFLSDLFTIKSG